jgi:site-specific DNA-methyltransferase (cytosine-N4-specific)
MKLPRKSHLGIKLKPYYTTRFGEAYLGDSLEIMRMIADDTVSLVVTSPPFPLQRKKPYGNVAPRDYVSWFMPYAIEMKRIIRRDGSVVIDLGGSWNKGQPTKSLYQWRLLIALCDIAGFHLAQEFYWYNPAKLPTPAEWVAVRRIRIKDAVNTILWLSKDPYPKASNLNVLRPYSQSMLELLENGYEANRRPSGHDISSKFQTDNNGAIPPNLIQLANTESNSRYMRSCKIAGEKPHPARFPGGIPAFFISLLTDQQDLVLDPFAGSNATGEVAQQLGRRWIAIELIEDYMRGSRLRFPEIPQTRRILLGLQDDKEKS